MSKSTPAAPAAAKTAAAAAAPAPAAAPDAAKSTETPAAAAPSPAPNYRVVSHLTHDNEGYEPGRKVYLTEKQAEPLLGHTVKPLAPKGDDE